MRLDLFNNPDFDRGASQLVELLWIVIQGLFFSSWLPGSAWRCVLLRVFGAQIGWGVVIKPGVNIKFPWRLVVGDYVWIGERVWIDNLDLVTVGAHSCISQGAYLCTGSHNWADDEFGLITKPITIGQSCWVGAFARVAPGCTFENGSVLAMHTLGKGLLQADTIYYSDGTVRPRSVNRKENKK